MQKYGIPLKDRREKKQTTRSARKRFELEREIEQLMEELDSEELKLINLKPVEWVQKSNDS